jgi:hypothetical protein
MRSKVNVHFNGLAVTRNFVTPLGDVRRARQRRHETFVLGLGFLPPVAAFRVRL